MNDTLLVAGAREHNLKDITVSIPRNSLAVFTGLSGSGKSSLAFDTIFAEGQRRYVESLSAYARQFLGQMDKPDVDLIEGLSPAVSIDQKSTSRNPRSTVGTITEVYDYLRLLYARAGQAYCPTCGEKIQAQSAEQIVDVLLDYPERTRIQVFAPVVRGRKGTYEDLFADVLAQGFARARVDGEEIRLESPPALEKQLRHDIWITVDRLVIRDGVRTRLTDSVEQALNLAEGLVIIDFVDRDADDPERTRRFSEKRACANGHPLTLDEMEPRTFSFNAPYGACPECSGIGSHLEVDPDLLVPDPSKTLAEGAIAPWGTSNEYFLRDMRALGEQLGFDVDTPFAKLPKKVRHALLHGKDYKVKVRYRNRWGRERVYASGFEGAVHYVERKHTETESDTARERYEGYMREVACSACGGTRLRDEVLAVRVGDLNIAELTDLSIDKASHYLDNLQLDGRARAIAGAVLKEIQVRLRFLVDVGLSYLTLSRAAGTLSGGEAQRIRLATQIGSGLTGVLYVLDEPSIGLHQRDNRRLITTLEKLRDLGNTLVVVEHDEDTIRAADWVVDIGPAAGEHGGHVVYSGPYDGLEDTEGSLTADYLSGRRQIAMPKKRRDVDPERMLRVVGAKENNLSNVSVSFPLGTFTVVSGVSGSGKSTLVNQILYRALAKELNRSRNVPGRHKRVEGMEHLDKVVHVDQSPIGRTPRSNPATYTGVWDHIRKLFAQTPEAKVRGYGPGRFSFNVKGGRCESCKGDGTLKIEMNFLPDVYVPCEVCRGARYNKETLEIRYKGKTVADILDMPVEEAAEFFSPIQAIARHLTTLVNVGLGYVRLGQAATTLSGGEAQRVKLASELHRRSNGRTIYVLDEPTTGLHMEDIRKLLLVLQGLVDKGNTVIVIEHNLDVIKCADWIVDMGPEGGEGGGQVIAEGTPETVAASPRSYTGRYLADVLGTAKK
ncbi:excinuclease ABC subunit UvrA [Nanchangia anserum]|uniref:UvrABC system protein A n=1 Tax=Nanchangia anserum TaxID=2692125 RepID=A0A8I0G6J5_9ACTO|nr:excinuclease ABC subunit UvrA [Nanchangia anserum]MBD3688710.1 excinuclease ABC subunit UvrA [Nanchangia anserum]QOX82457.1 excinuclease ABC subunit UvrA [Nanchangia anserum]